MTCKNLAQAYLVFYPVWFVSERLPPMIKGVPTLKVQRTFEGWGRMLQEQLYHLVSFSRFCRWVWGGNILQWKIVLNKLFHYTFWSNNLVSIRVWDCVWMSPPFWLEGLWLVIFRIYFQSQNNFDSTQLHLAVFPSYSRNLCLACNRS